MTEDRDEVLDDLRRALAIEPSPEFTARVRMAVAETAPQRARWMWVAAAGLGAVVIAAGVSIWQRPGMRTQTELVGAASVRPAADPSAPSIAITKSRPGSAMDKASARPVTASRHRVREPEILVPPGQATALARLMERIRDGHTTLALAKWSEGPVVVAPVPDVDPIRIDTLPEPTPVDPAQVDRTDS